MRSCSTCSAQVIPGNMHCDDCGAPVSKIKAVRKLRQASFDTIKDAKHGLLQPGERLRYYWHTYIIEEAIARSGFAKVNEFYLRGCTIEHDILRFEISIDKTVAVNDI